MGPVKQLVLWLFRAWPVLAVLALMACHLLTWHLLPTHSVMINKVAGTLMQIVGGLFVLLAIDGNLGLFRRQTLLSVVVGWFRDIPLFRRSVIITATGVSTSSAISTTATVTVERRFSTVEERLVEVERQVKELRVTLDQQGAALLGRVEEVKSELSKGLVVGQAALQELSTRIEVSTVGGFKQQAFGVLLAIYGAVVSVFA